MTTARREIHAHVEKLGQIAQGFFASSAINAVTRLGIAELLDNKPLSVEEMAERTETNKDALARVMRLLCSLGIFKEIEHGVFANSEASNLMKADHENSQKDMLLFISNPLHFKAYTDMMPTLRDGRSAAHHTWGKGIFDVFAEDEEEQRLFDNAMTSFSRRAIPGILDAYDFSGIGKLVDVAGGHGALLTSILLEYPDMNGVLFDLPHVAPGASARIESLDLAHRCEVVSGDFFKEVPSGDAIVMKHIIHDWNDDEAAAILRNCHKALTKSGPRKVLLVEMLLAEINQACVSKFMDIEMLMLPGGRERTENQFAELFESAGFELNEIFRSKGPWVVLEAVAN